MHRKQQNIINPLHKKNAWFLYKALTPIVGFQAASNLTFSLLWCGLEPNLWSLALHTNQSFVSVLEILICTATLIHELIYAFY